jgi:chemotaxis protein MotB
MSHGGGDDGGKERWLISYADFITLLMVMFVVLYSMSQIDVKKYKLLAAGLRIAFSGGPEAIVDPQINQGGALSDEEEAAPIVIPGIPKRDLDAVEVAGELTDMLASSELGGMVSVQNNLEGVLISVSEKILFIQGTAELQPDAYPVLDAVLKMIKQLDNDVKIIGYTDDTQPDGEVYEDNWELSTARALKIVHYFQAAGVEPARLIAAGRGEYQPLFPNDTPEHRALNSRAEIIVVYPVHSDVLDLPIINQPKNETGE